MGPTTEAASSGTWGTVLGAMNHSVPGDYFSFSLMWQHSSGKKGNYLLKPPLVRPVHGVILCKRQNDLAKATRKVSGRGDVNPRLSNICAERSLPPGEGENKKALHFFAQEGTVKSHIPSLLLRVPWFCWLSPSQARSARVHQSLSLASKDTNKEFCSF